MENIYLEKLKHLQEIIPEKYDGSYELVKETVKQYQYISLENVDFPDIDLIYFMTVGTWAYGIDKRKELIENSALDQPKKEYLNMLIDKIWDNAQKEMYIHKEFEGKTSIGMFGSGFRTFNGACDIDTVKRYISLMVNVNQMDNEEEILNYVERELQVEYKGIGIASFSQVLHCLKPHIFPIVNGNMGKRTTIYSKLEIEIDSKITPQNYIKNVRKIREFRNNNFSWKNYRIIDLLKVEENKMLENLNYEKLDEIIRNYKSEFNKFYLDELYKWEAIKTFQDNWDIDAENFSEMLNNSLKNAGNLLVSNRYFAKKMIVDFAEYEPETVRNMFKQLFDENLELDNRIKKFMESAKSILYKYCSKDKDDFQDAHAISIYLTFRYPEKYYMYKYRVINTFFKLIDVKISFKNKIEFLIKYFDICDKILTYIKLDKELIELSQNSLTDKCYKDFGYHTLVFDLIYYVGTRYKCDNSEFYDSKDDFLKNEEYVENSFDDIIEDNNERIDRISGGLNKIFYGAPGCGKSFHITKTFCTEDNIYFRTTFHPDYTNGDFIGQIIPKLKDNQVFYDIQEGPFSKALAEAIKNPDKKVCLIIEEINRGNASAIFGDVFQLLDRDKTGKSIFEINNYIIQEYLRREEIIEIDGQKIDKIFIPSNLWILATMNTSDQNVFTLDTAFKRRWQLEKIKNIFKFEDKYENEADVEYDKKLAAMLVPGTDWTWKKFVYWINDNIVKKDTFSVNGEDKQIGVYFVKEDELWESNSEMDDKEERKKRFAEKVLMYLWEDVTRLNRDSWFCNEYRTLDQLINAFNDSKIRLNIFKDIAVENSTIVATNSESSDENE